MEVVGLESALNQEGGGQGAVHCKEGPVRESRACKDLLIEPIYITHGRDPN